MVKTAKIIPFPTPLTEIACVCCKFRYELPARQNSAFFDIQTNTISIPDQSDEPGCVYQLDDQSIPAASSGNICENCIDVLIKYDRAKLTDPVEHPPSYEISFVAEDGTHSGYAFLCYNAEHWQNFISAMRENFDQTNISASASPKDDCYPCIVICRGLSPSNEGGPRKLLTEILAQACVFRETG